jgi:preprotein translocase subunit SecG
MQSLLTIAIIVVCVLLILVVLVQNSKGGGISSNFTAANQIMGARRGTDFIEKTTWTLAILLLVLSLLATPKKGSTTDDAPSLTKEILDANGGVAPGAGQSQPAQPAGAGQPVQPAANPGATK